MSTETITQAETLVSVTRRALDLLDGADVSDPTLYVFPYLWGPSVHLDWNADSPDELRRIIRALGSTPDSPWEKKLGGSDPKLVREVDESIRLTVVAGYAVCSQVQVGEKTETVEKVVEPAKTVAVEETVPVLEWRCPDSLFADVEAVDA